MLKDAKQGPRKTFSNLGVIYSVYTLQQSIHRDFGTIHWLLRCQFSREPAFGCQLIDQGIRLFPQVTWLRCGFMRTVPCRLGVRKTEPSLNTVHTRTGYGTLKFDRPLIHRSLGSNGTCRGLVAHPIMQRPKESSRTYLGDRHETLRVLTLPNKRLTAGGLQGCLHATQACSK